MSEPQRCNCYNGIALKGLFVLVLLYAISIARPVLLPIVLALLLSFVLAPVVAWFERRGVPRTIGSAAMVLLLIGAIAGTLHAVAEPASRWLSEAPEMLEELEEKLQFLNEPVSGVSQAAAQVTEMGQERPAPERVAVVQTPPAVTLLRGARGLVGTLFMSFAFLFFFLWMGRLFVLKLVRVLPTFSSRKRALKAARDVRRHASVHLTTVTAINTVLGMAIGSALYLLDVPNAFLWGVMAGLLNFVPYLGAVTGIVIVTIVAVTSVEPIAQALLAPFAYFVMTGLEGAVITPSILGNRMRLNPVAILVSVLFWGWIWGVPGALLAAPLVATTKVIADAYPPMSAVGEFLGR